MNSLRKFITPCRIVFYVKRRFLFTNIPIHSCYSFSTRSLVYKLDTFGARNMSQKSITSFFKTTPKKAPEVSEKKRKEVRSCGVKKHKECIQYLYISKLSSST